LLLCTVHSLSIWGFDILLRGGLGAPGTRRLCQSDEFSQGYKVIGWL